MKRVTGWKPCERVMSVLAVASGLGLFLSCGGGASSPTSPPGASGTGSVVLSGRVVGTIGSQPVVGARVEMAGATATTGSSGDFELRTSSHGVFPVTVSAPNHEMRKTFVRTDGPRPAIDVIEKGGLWNLDFYRELCRDGSGGGDRRPLNPWTVEPRFYIDRRPESGRNRPIPDAAVETVREAIRTVVPLLSGGKFSGNQIEEGTEPPPDSSPGTVVIRWDPVEVSQAAGPASGFTRGVGGNASVVVVRTIEDTEVIFHELGHVLGLYHPLSGTRPSLMLGTGNPARPHFTDWDVHHANIMYARPPGNTDIDEDPQGFILNCCGQ